MVHPLVVRLINNKRATLAELGSVYSTRDAWILDETLNVQEEVDYLMRQKNGNN